MPRILLGLFLVLLTASVAAAVGHKWLWTHIRGLVLIGDFRREPLVLRPFHEAVQMTEVTTETGVIARRLYVPVHHPDAPTVVFLAGMGRKGAEDPVSTLYARRLAESGVRVLAINIAPLEGWLIDPEALRVINENLRWSLHSTREKISLFGLSFSGGLALVAAAQPEFADRIKVVFIDSGYDDLTRLARYSLGKGEPLPDGRVDRSTPDPLGRMLLAYHHLDSLVPPEDLAAVRRALLAAAIADPGPHRRDALKRLNPRQQQECLELETLSTPAVRQKLQAALDASSPESAALSPHGHLAGLKARVFLLHGSDDLIIPEGESEWLLHDLPPTARGQLFTTPVISHVLTHKGHWLEKLRVANYLADVLYAVKYHS